MKKRIIREYFSIPNLMGYLRILLIPVYLYLYVHAETTRDYYIAAAVMFLCFMTDFLTGKLLGNSIRSQNLERFLIPLQTNLLRERL